MRTVEKGADREGWMQMRSFVIREEIRTGLTQGGVYARIYSGAYPLKFKRINKRVVFVKRFAGRPKPAFDQQRPGEIQLKVWVMNKAAQLGISIQAAWMRLSRGQIDRPTERRVNKRLIFVQTGATRLEETV